MERQVKKGNDKHQVIIHLSILQGLSQVAHSLMMTLGNHQEYFLIDNLL
jgi:hypothetical protein